MVAKAVPPLTVCLKCTHPDTSELWPVEETARYFIQKINDPTTHSWDRFLFVNPNDQPYITQKVALDWLVTNKHILGYHFDEDTAKTSLIALQIEP